MGSDAAAELGRKRWKGVSKEERTAHARAMNEARWGKKKTARKRARRTV